MPDVTSGGGGAPDVGLESTGGGGLADVVVVSSGVTSGGDGAPNVTSGGGVPDVVVASSFASCCNDTIQIMFVPINSISIYILHMIIF